MKWKSRPLPVGKDEGHRRFQVTCGIVREMFLLVHEELELLPGTQHVSLKGSYR